MDNQDQKAQHVSVFRRIYMEIYEFVEAVVIIIANLLRVAVNDMRNQPGTWGKLIYSLLFLISYLLFTWLFNSSEVLE